MNRSSGLGEECGARRLACITGKLRGLPLVFLDEGGQLGSGSAQQALHAGLRRLHVLHQVLPVAEPLAQVAPLTGLEKVHQLFHFLLLEKETKSICQIKM